MDMSKVRPDGDASKMVVTGPIVIAELLTVRFIRVEYKRIQRVN